LELYESEAEVVRRIYQDFVVKNMSIREIRDALEADRISIPRIATAHKSTNNQEEIKRAKSKVSDSYRWREKIN
jgi:Trp operon repressor